MLETCYAGDEGCLTNVMVVVMVAEVNKTYKKKVEIDFDRKLQQQNKEKIVK